MQPDHLSGGYVKHAGKLSLAVGAVAIGTLAFAAPAMAATPAVHVKPNTGLVNNQKVTVSVSGFPAATQVFVVECSKKPTSASTAGATCNATASTVGKITTNASGAGSTKFTVKTGQVGTSSTSKCLSKKTCLIGAATVTGTSAWAKITFK